MKQQSKSLQLFLNQLHERYHRREFLSSDPLEFAHQFQDPWDQEAVALLAAVLAYGNVKQIRRSLADALNRIDQVSPAGPAAFVRKLQDPKFARRASQVFESFVHRFNRGADLVILFGVLSRSWREHGSLGAHFLSALNEKDPHFGPALDQLMKQWKNWAKELAKAGWKLNDSFSYLLTAPEDGSCCKRWCMFLRWMGRDDELDLGLWARPSALSETFPKGKFLKTEQLIIPLDTHTGRISQYLGLTRRKSLNWLAAVEVTDSLRQCHPSDPTRYDFSISRLGILDLCQKKFRVEICQNCELVKVCHYARQHKG